MSFSRYYSQLLRQARRSGPTALEARRDFQALVEQQVLALGRLL